MVCSLPVFYVSSVFYSIAVFFAWTSRAANPIGLRRGDRQSEERRDIARGFAASFELLHRCSVAPNRKEWLCWSSWVEQVCTGTWQSLQLNLSHVSHVVRGLRLRLPPSPSIASQSWGAKQLAGVDKCRTFWQVAAKFAWRLHDGPWWLIMIECNAFLMHFVYFCAFVLHFKLISLNTSFVQQSTSLAFSGPTEGPWSS